MRLFWSLPDFSSDLDDPRELRLMYETVLREAIRPEELTGYLNGDTLVTLWPDLYLPKDVRRAWEYYTPRDGTDVHYVFMDLLSRAVENSYPDLRWHNARHTFTSGPYRTCALAKGEPSSRGRTVFGPHYAKSDPAQVSCFSALAKIGLI
jgi:hypothetical protein